MEFKDYYATLGLARTATQDQIKRAYRKLARKYHPDVSKEPDAEARFKQVAEAHEALIDPERRAAYDDIAQRQSSGQPFSPPPGWDSGFEFSGRGDGGMPQGGQEGDYSEFFESLFGRFQGSRSGQSDRAPRRPAAGPRPMPGQDHHAKLLIDLQDAYRGAQRTVSLRVPVIDDAGRAVLQERQLAVDIPAGMRPGQRLRLSGQGAPGPMGGPAGDLYLEIQVLPDPVFRLDGRDIHFDLPVSPWEAALGATVTAPTPDGSVELGIPAGSGPGRKLRLKGRGLPGKEPGDLYAELVVAIPPAGTQAAKDAYGAMQLAFADFNPRTALGA